MLIKPYKPGYIKFKAGKATLYSDFDGTYMPLDHSDVCKNGKPVDKKEFYNVFDNFKKFMTQKGEKFSFNITSGRNLYEWLFFVNKLHKKGLKAPLPQKMFATNGGDVFERTQGETYIPATPIEKKEEIKKLSNWDDNVKKDLMQMFENEGYKIIEPKINSNEKEYDKQNAIQAFFNQDSKEKFAAFRKDDELNLSVIFNYKRNGTSKEEFEVIGKKINKYLKKNNIKAKLNGDYNGKYSGGYPDYCLVPLLSEKEELTKVYDTKVALKKAKQENDMIITAGDGTNDKEMLNPLNYLDLPSDLNKFDTKKVKKYLEANPEKLEELKKLPFGAIVVVDDVGSYQNRSSHKSAPIEIDFLNMVNEMAGNKKFFVTPRGGLQQGIEAAIAEYAKINQEFAKDLEPKKLTKQYKKTLMQIDDRLIIGPQPAERLKSKGKMNRAEPESLKKDFELIKSWGVSDVIDLRHEKHESIQELEDEKKCAEDFGIKYHNIQSDGGKTPSKDEVNRFFNIMKNASGKVYLHCYAGQDRTGIYSALYTAYTQGRNFDEIGQYIFDFRGLINENGTSKRWKYMWNKPHEKQLLRQRIENLRKHGRENDYDLAKF